MGEQKSKKVSEEDALKDAEKMLADLKKVEEAKKPVTEEAETGKEESKEAGKTTKPKKAKKAKIRSQKYQEALAKIDRTKLYEVDEAIKLLKATSYSKFDGSVELHARLVAKKASEPIALRKLFSLPHKAGKEPKIALLDEALIEKIIKEKNTEFDILIASPEIMPKLGRIAKILGPQGKMPNPKSGTITKEPDKAIAEIKAGKIEIKTDKLGNVHQVIGKVSWDDAKIKENVLAIMALLPTNQLVGVTLCASMGPGIKVKIKK